jgi:hypothetical protein
MGIRMSAFTFETDDLALSMLHWLPLMRCTQVVLLMHIPQHFRIVFADWRAALCD